MVPTAMLNMRQIAVLLVTIGLFAVAPARAMPLPGMPGQGTPLLVQVKGGLLDFLFGPSSPSRTPQADVGRAGNRSGLGTSSGYRPRSASMPKDPNAKKIYIFGDAFAGGLETGLQIAFAETPTIEIVKRIKPGSGIVRDDYYDWQAELAQFLETEQIDIAVMMIGSNDRQPIRRDGSEETAVRSDKWQEIYISRVDKLLKQFSDRKIPVYWVGLPIMRPQNYGQDIAYLNELFQARVQRAGGKFIDTWSRFADEEGRYSAAGPDINGKIRRLRNDNGIHMTRNGNIKLAFFVEQELRSDLETGGVFANIPLLGPGAGAARPAGPVEMEISLTAPAAAAAGTALRGAASAAQRQEPQGEASDYQLLVVGKSPQAKTGRADDFSWPRGAAKPGAGEKSSQPGS